MASPRDLASWLLGWLGRRGHPVWVLDSLAAEARAIRPYGRVLDSGGGWGALIRVAHWDRPDLSYTIADDDPRKLRLAPGFAETALAPPERLPFPDHSFHGVFLTRPLHAYRNPGEALLEAYRVTEPGGRIWLHDYHPHYQGLLPAIVYHRLARREAGFYDQNAIQRLLKELGLAFEVWFNNKDVRVTAYIKRL